MKRAYPVILTPAEGTVLAYFPDFDTGTEGADLAEAIDMSADAIGLLGITLEDEGKPIPEPTPPANVETVSAGDIVTLVSVDFSDYRRKNDMRTVRRNVSLPSWLNAAAEKAGLNVSAVLQNALKKELHLS